MPKQIIPVSVVVPNYNSGSYLPECIASINTGHWPVEILIVDDCSTDGSLELAIGLQSKYKNVRVIHTARNSGAAEARRIGVMAASQDWFAFVDADDLVEHDALSAAYERLVSTRADICIWEIWRMESGMRYKGKENPDNFPVKGRDAVLLTLGHWRIHPLGVSRKDLYVEAYEGFDELAINADELLTRIVFSKANEIVGCEKKYFYRLHPKSTTRRWSARRLSALQSHLWLLKFARDYPEAPIQQMTLDALWEAWFYWTKRNQIGVHETMSAIRNFLPDFFELSGSKSWLWRHPKYFGAFLFLWGYASFNRLQKFASSGNVGS